MISVDGLTVEFGGSALFSDISFVINEKDRIALMGKNGAGKSTLLKILAGVREPTRGKVSAPKDTVIAYLPQHLMTEDGRTVFEETAQAFVHLHEMEAEIAALNKELETRTDYESDSYMELIERVSTLSEKFYSIEEINYDADIEKTLLGLGFTREDFNRQTSEFSGGWRMRIELAKLLLKKPDVLLLDEPTNHLDIESIQWLEDFLIDNGQAVVVISHDRAFVDHITTRTIEVTMGRIYDYKVNYSQYLQLRKERREQQQKAYDEQQKFIAETKDFIERYKEDGIIWFLEACDLNVFSIRRAMWQMEQAGWFEHVKAFLIGRPLCFGQDMMGLDPYQAVLPVALSHHVPVIMDVDLGHLPPMMPLIVGSLADVTVSGNDIRIDMQLR